MAMSVSGFRSGDSTLPARRGRVTTTTRYRTRRGRVRVRCCIGRRYERGTRGKRAEELEIAKKRVCAGGMRRADNKNGRRADTAESVNAGICVLGRSRPADDPTDRFRVFCRFISLPRSEDLRQESIRQRLQRKNR